MFKRIFGYLLVIFTLPVFAATPDELIKQTMQEYISANDIPGAAVVLYLDGKPYSYYFGYANREKKKPVTRETIFEIGSVSKVMTSLLLAEELDFARVQLEQPVKKYLNQLPDNFADMSILSLATHTSGLPFDLPDEIKSQSDWAVYAKEWQPTTAPVKSYQYSNVGIGLLGEIIERVEHKNIDKVYKKKLASRLDMQPLGIRVPKEYKKYMATGYNVDGSPTAPIKAGLFPAAYGVKLSVADMKKFLRAAIGLKGTPDSIFYPMRMTQTPYVAMGSYKQGLGWQIHDLGFGSVNWLMRGGDNLGLKPIAVDRVFDEPTYDGDALIDKTGATNGFRTYVAVIPNKNTGIAIMLNRNIPGKSIKTTGRKILFKLNNLA